MRLTPPGIGYNITLRTGRLCGGPCPHDQYDVYHYYWIWDMNALLDVKKINQIPISQDLSTMVKWPYPISQLEGPKK
jgi:hypothetical protein